MSNLYISLCEYMKAIARDKEWWQKKIDEAKKKQKNEPQKR